MRAVVLACILGLALPSCAFEAPSAPSAHDRCYEYAAELERKMLECGDSQTDMDAFNARNLAKCDRVAFINPLHESVDACIDQIRRIDCASRNKENWCSAFVESGL